ncbi:hypothetical protein [Trichormus variabilis]|uniref:Uncharacterized protein n=1 Tax=Trichormus variabilis SAG 1403-4b TaxID=447716 RepID=A0A433UIT2_ANAVA|nr:hypothetical protein [Trichormus variabilis]MBD2628839.1 hypothetical protein [Trichormus variabilis FACHB-164]RUS93756.1 hypothetical protein DSM107003_42570 [Trichormus variabilis SAG 1403-4b]
MSTLFNLDEYNSLPECPRLIDPAWDEIVLDCSGKVESNGQTTLFYDHELEPPEPDDYRTNEEYCQAWIEWEKKNPESIDLKDWKRTYKGHTSEFFVIKRGKGFYRVQFTITDNANGLMLGTFEGNYDVPSLAELDFLKEVDNQVVLEKPVKGFHFEEGAVYWHSSRNCKFKITKLLASVSKAQGYFAGEIVKKKVLLSELRPVNEDVDYPEKSSPILPEQANSVLEKSKINQWIETYYVNRSGSKYWYYRYCYYQGRIKHIHIPGGNTTSDKCLEIKQKVESAIALGQLPEQIQQLIKSA